MNYAVLDIGTLPHKERLLIKSKFEWVHFYSWMDGSEEICVRSLDNIRLFLYDMDLSDCIRVTDVFGEYFIAHQDQTVKMSFINKYGD